MKIQSRSFGYNATCRLSIGQGNVSLQVVDSSADNIKGQTVTVPLSALAKVLPAGYQLTSGRLYWVSFNSTMDEVRFMRPAKGEFTVKFTGFAKTDNGDYLVMSSQSEYTGATILKVVANAEVVEGNEKGLVYPVYLQYTNSKGEPVFQRDGKQVGVFGFEQKSPKLKFLKAFFEGAGWDDNTDITFVSDDPQDMLRAIELVIVPKGVVFSMTVDRGYPMSFGLADFIGNDFNDAPVTVSLDPFEDAE